MDPVSAIGLASGILTFVEAGLKLVKIAYNIHNSLDGVLDDNRHRENVTSEVSKAALRLEVAGNARLTPEQESLSDLARKCKATSTDLVKALNQVKPKQSSSNPFKLLRYAVKAEIKAKDISELENRLKDYRDQLTLTLVDFSRVQSAGGFNEIISVAKGNEATLKSMTQAIEHLRQSQLSAPDSIANTQAFSQFQRLLMVDEETRGAIYQDRILESLKFDEMKQRFDAVHNAHEDTFKWIYEAIEVIKEDGDLSYMEKLRQEALKMQLKSRERFIGWLLSQDPSLPIFHISGKLGSGKSTLMKFLCSHHKTENALIKWAGAKKFAFTSFFFWRNGSKAQKSLDGLCRSILHDVLRERPDLIPEVFPGQWCQAKQAPWRVENRQEIPSCVIKGALERLLQNKKLYQQHRFCIFIDGLDEFEPGVQDGLDYIDLVNILRQWTIHAYGNLKLCLSSREEGVFMDEYESDPGLRLQDLTRIDMQNYVCSRLSNLKDQDLKGEFVNDIPDKSSGIFLWTYLVVKTIRNKMTHKATSETLRKHLNMLPRGLESLFHHIIRQLEPGDARKTLRIIDALQTTKWNKLELPLLTFSLLDEYDEDSEFSLRDGLEDELIPDEEILQAQLRGACGGLIECHKGTCYKGLQILDFVHRSVPDMFHNDVESSELARQMEVALRGTNTIDVVSHLCLATFRLSGQTGTRDIEISTCKSIGLMRLKGRVDKPPYPFLEYIGSWANDRWLDDSQTRWQFFFTHSPRQASIWIRPYGAAAIGSNNPRLLYNNMCLAAHSGHIDYLEWKFVNDANALNNSVRRALVGHFILISEHWEIFFEKSIFTMESNIPLIPAVIGQGLSNDNWVVPDPVTLSPWQIYLVYVILTFGWHFDSFEDRGNVMERFLRQRADPYCRIVVAGEGSNVSMTICFRELKTHHIIADVFSILVFGNFVKEVFEKCLTLRGKPRVDWDNFTEEFLFREWIPFTDWPNRDTLLELLDCNYE
ncbi:hypothetical protein BFJ66_g5127 [Fusarium oxysporum f. sp. cepae]|uniref:Nephrocystin 3-like N-terminal domain-containing protein n=1 Tax=Fusarium oxysporum f. sp. cepae TaxID=396571 RepID=A0A3L6MYC4_FUSOX|nr:hypothetical protein BFJ65_g15650 [Fusarium oxysporum f. sp. cepae]RKK53407.1 hypothetical protein BFJ66_g5127 [Fusarium oxysporum f. sp. cepae]RKK54538.1 hypothetical protein BFJ67_g4624 [Fusarium oxysporum f. sp. cepae]